MRAPFFLSLLLVGCVDLDKARAFRCEDDTGCAGGWVCLKDQFCHDPSIGAEVACVTRADCTGGWFCGQEGKCLDPQRPAAFACDDDAQCASPWRCSSERRCVDLSKEPAALGFAPALSAPALRSPFTTAFDLLRTSPLQTSVELDGVPYTAFESVLARGNTIERALLYGRDSAGATGYSAQRFRVEFPAPSVDLAVVVGSILVKPATGPLLLATGSRAVVEVPTPFAVDHLVPLAWNESTGASRGSFAAVGGGQALFIDPSGRVIPLGTDVVDVTAAGSADDAGVPLLVMLRSDAVGERLTFEPLGEPAKSELIVDLSALAGGSTPLKRALRVRFEHGAFGVLFEDSSGIQVQYVPTLVCAEFPCDGGVVPGVPCDVFADLALPEAGRVRTSCPEPGFATDLLYDSSAETAFDFVAARPAHRSWGTSGGHVRQTEQGQLSWSSSLEAEVTDVLNVRPDVFGVVDGQLLALAGQDLYTTRPATSDAGAPLGLSLRARLKPGLVARPIAFVEGAQDLQVLETGVVVSGSMGSAEYPFALPVPPAPDGTRARLLQTAAGAVLVVTSRDDLYAGVEAAGGLTLLVPALRPSPGFPIADWALRPADGGFLEGWVVANNKLFRVTASAVERWKSNEVAVTGRDPLGVWFSGEAAQLGTASGEVLSLPSRVPVVPGLLDGVTGMTGLCGSVFATTLDGLWEVVPADAGLGAWRKLELPTVFRPILQRSDQRLFVVDEDGVVLEVPVSCP